MKAFKTQEHYFHEKNSSFSKYFSINVVFQTNFNSPQQTNALIIALQHRNFSPQFYFVTFVTIKMTAKFPASNQSNFSLTCFIFVVMFFFLQKLRSWILEHCCTLFFMLLVNISRKISPCAFGFSCQLLDVEWFLIEWGMEMARS